MLDIISVYEDVARDNANKDENGYLAYEMFNRLSRRAELRLIDFLTGHLSAQIPPDIYDSQKAREFISPFIVPYPANVSGGKITKPSDYYQYENMYLLSGQVTSACEEDEDDDAPYEEGCNIPIELLSNEQFFIRCNTHIRLLKPSFKKPIAKMVGRSIEFKPADLGSITLEYIRYPKFGEIKAVMDTVYNEPVADPATSLKYEWDENARELLVWFITDTFSIHTRERALKESNAMTGKTAKG